MKYSYLYKRHYAHVMKIKATLIACTVILAASCQNNDFPQGKWEGVTYGKLCSVIDANSSYRPEYNIDEKPYAIFDLDNTMVIGDLVKSLFRYQVMNLKFKFTPEQVHSVLSEGIPNLDMIIHKESITIGMLIDDVSDDYSYLYENYIAASYYGTSGLRFKDILSTNEYQDFCAKMIALSKGISKKFSYEKCCRWHLNALKGMNRYEADVLSKTAVQYLISLGDIHTDSLQSHFSGHCGIVKTHYREGIKVIPEMVSLMKRLRKKGFDIYVISSSPEEMVESIACNPEYGFNIAPENVYGTRIDADKDYIQPVGLGKPLIIKKNIMPQYGNREPVIIAGYYPNDQDMLTFLKKTQLVLVTENGHDDCSRSHPKRGNRTYVHQVWDR